MTILGVPQGEASAPSFRDLLKAEVERLTAALRDNQPFEPFHFDDKKEQPACNSSSVTI
jgi:hypothetical protein